MNENVTVQWNKLPNEANYVAMDHGDWHWFTKKPTFNPLSKQWDIGNDCRWGALNWRFVSYNSLVTSENSLTPRHTETMSEEPIMEYQEKRPPKPHKHAELIKMWADDPSLRFEVRYTPNEEWVPTVKDIPAWDEDAEYRVKPKVMYINGIEVPAPESSAPAMGTQYFVPNLQCSKDCGHADVIAPTWSGSDADIGRLECGMVHLNAENAAIHKRAIVAANKSY